MYKNIDSYKSAFNTLTWTHLTFYFILFSTDKTNSINKLSIVTYLEWK